MQIIDEVTIGVQNRDKGGGNPYLDTWEKAIADIAPPRPPEGEITRVHFYNPKTDKYQAKPPGIDVGQTVGLYALGDNLSGAAQVMKIRVELYDPDEVQLNYDERELEIDYPGTIGSYNVTGVATKEGNYTGKVKLWVADILVDSWEGLVATTEKFPWHWLAIGLGALGAILLIPKKKK